MKAEWNSALAHSRVADQENFPPSAEDPAYPWVREDEHEQNTYSQGPAVAIEDAYRRTAYLAQSPISTDESHPAAPSPSMTAKRPRARMMIEQVKLEGRNSKSN